MPSGKEIAALAKAAGHEVHLESRDRREEFPNSYVKWWAVCTCGYRSAVRGREVLAAAAAMHHVVKTAEELDRNGMSVDALQKARRPVGS